MPLPPAGSPPRRDMPPSPLSPSSGSAFPAAAAADDDEDHDAAAAEPLCVTLLEWWLATVEGDEQKMAVAGTFEQNATLKELCPAPIVKRHAPNILESEDGIILVISGSLNVSLSHSNGYSKTACEHFFAGFPYWWQSCNLRYPKLKNSYARCEPCPSNSIYSGMDLTQSYLEKPQLGGCLDSYITSSISKLPDIFRSFSREDSVFPKSSHLSNETPRFEEYTCDGDTATIENAAASSEAGEAPTVECTDNAVSEAVDNTPATGTCHKTTPTASLKNQCSSRENQRVASNKKPVGRPKKQQKIIGDWRLDVGGCCEETQHMALTEKAAVDEQMPTSVYLDVQNSFSVSNGTPILEEYTCDGDIRTNEYTAASNDDNERYTAPSKEVNNVEIGFIARSPSSERGHDDIATGVSLAPTVECNNNAVSEAVDNTPATGTCRTKTPVASLKNQGSSRENQHIASNKKPVGRPKKQISPHEKCQSATRSPGIRSPVSYVHWSPLTRGKAALLSMSTPEALKLTRTRSGRVIVPTLDERCQSIVYGRDGWISGVIGLDSPATSKLSESIPERRKKRRTELASSRRNATPGEENQK